MTASLTMLHAVSPGTFGGISSASKQTIDKYLPSPPISKQSMYTTNIMILARNPQLAFQ